MKSSELKNRLKKKLVKENDQFYNSPPKKKMYFKNKRETKTFLDLSK